MRKNYQISLLILGVMAILATIGCGPSAGGDGGAKAGSPAASGVGAVAMASESKALGYIPSSEAGSHLGEEGTVRGSVKDYQYQSGKKGRPYILLFDVAGVVERGSGVSDMETPQTFTVVIWKDDRNNFLSNFAVEYTGRTVCVTGMIEDYDGSPSIVARDPSQLKLDC